MLTSEEFFDTVDRFLTPAMTTLGYHRIGGYVNDQPASRRLLSTSGHQPSAAETDPPKPFLLFDFGFEAGSDDVERLVDPEDAGYADELWLSFDPATGELDLRAWEFVAGGLDWDPSSDLGPCGKTELRRRLEQVGHAVIGFAT
jgi:hypothetical protein